MHGSALRLSGDWNVAQDSLPAFGLLSRAGFRDLQDIALERWGKPLQHTCKGRTRRDFFYVSPELQDLLLDVEMHHDVWPDHSVLVGKFQKPALLPYVMVWPTPEPFPWPTWQGDGIGWPAEVDDMSNAYANLWGSIEHSAQRAASVVVRPRMKGRAAVIAPKQVRPGLSAPLKKGRKGDFQPGFFGTSVKHAQWVRQARRLQAYARLATSRSPHVAVQCAEAWGAILRAKGFVPTFSAWWHGMNFKTAAAPVGCPAWPPEAQVANEIFDSVAMAVRAFEVDLRKHSRQYARLRRDQNPNLVFADIRPPAVPGVDVLLQPIRAVVDEVDVENGQLVLDHACAFQPDQVIACDGIPLKVIHHSEDAVWVEDASGITVGSNVTQMKYVGSHQDLESAFVSAWRDRWMRHADVPPERWDCIVQFAKRFMPRLNLQWDSMQGHDIKRIVRTKKRSTSSGFDGVSLADLRAMPDSVLNAFTDMFLCAERHGAWPSQLVDGRVVSLAKVACPGSPADFRPITVFGLLYRVWSSFHSKHALRLLDEALPETLYGSRPGHYAAQVWAKLLWSMEHSFEHSVELTGLVADLQKAFNMIPRLVVFELAGHIGMPGGMLVAWAGALSQMQRRFLLRGSLTEGVPSVTGFPEGCGLSCVAMVIIDFAFHLWQRTFFPLCTALSYVDDWQILCPHGSLMEGAKHCLDLFVQAVDLQLDDKKTDAWSLTAEGRQALRRGGFRVVLAAKNLGAHVQMSRKHTNFSLVDRISGMAAIWPRLRISACKYRLKIRAILVAAWPRALHAVASTLVGDAVIHSLRTGALKGLGADGSGCNAWVQLGLVEHPLVDPGFWSIIHTIRCARDCGDPVQVQAAMVKLTQSPDAVPANSITSTLLSRLQMLAWHVMGNGLIHDQFGEFSLFEACMSELVLRAQWAWQKVVAEQVAHRPGFRDLQFVDAADTRVFLKTLAVEDLELFHKCLNGTHITQDGKAYCQEGGSSQCPYCDCTGSRFHRFWVCERFQAEREGLPSDVLALIPSLPDVVTGYGWSLRPYTSLEWYSYLCNICVPSVNPMQDMYQEVHLFTDGSCLNPEVPICRLAAWAVVFADFEGPFAGSVIESGPLPGMLQNSYRAEIFAVWRALSIPPTAEWQGFPLDGLWGGGHQAEAPSTGW